MDRTTTFKEMMSVYDDCFFRGRDWDDFYDEATLYIRSILISKPDLYLNTFTKNQILSIVDRLTLMIDCFPDRHPYTSDSAYASRINKIEDQPHMDSYWYLWKDPDKLYLGSFHPYNDLGPKKSVTVKLYLDSKNGNLLANITSKVKDDEKVANLCFVDFNHIYTREPNSVGYIQSVYDDLKNLIFTDRFDPFHIGQGSNDLHYNNFSVYEGTPQKELYEKFFKEKARTPHIHFYTENVCLGKPIKPVKDATNHLKGGNEKSLAINLNDLSRYIDELNKALIEYTAGKPFPDILRYDLGMPYLSVAYGSTSFKSSYLITKIKKLSEISEQDKKDIISQLQGSNLVRLGLQFFAKESNNQPPSNSKIHAASTQLKKLSAAYKFIARNIERLTAKEQTELISAINAGMQTYEKVIIHETESNDEFEPML